jgi:hypothetical protein
LPVARDPANPRHAMNIQPYARPHLDDDDDDDDDDGD